MVKVNLLPTTQREKIKIRRKKTLIIILVFIFMIILAGIVGGLFLLNNKFTSDLTSLKSDLGQQKNRAKEYYTLTSQIKELSLKLTDLKKVLLDQIYWSKILKDIATRIPQDARINSIQSSGGVIKITGIATSRRTIAKFKNKLEESDFFINTDLVSTSLLDPKKSTPVSFDFELILKGYVSEKKETPNQGVENE